MGSCLSQPSDLVAVTSALGAPTRSLGSLRLYLYVWHAFALDKLLRHARRTQVSLNNRMAELHQRLADQEATLNNALRRVMDATRPDEPSDQTATCIVCFDTCLTTECVQCSGDAQHHHCLRCVDRFAATMASQHSLPTACPCLTLEQNCSGAIATHDLMRCEHGERLVREWHHRASMKRVASILDGADDVLSMRVRYMRSDGTYAAAACPRCKFGPLEYFRCDDLVEFDDRSAARPPSLPRSLSTPLTAARRSRAYSTGRATRTLVRDATFDSTPLVPSRRGTGRAEKAAAFASPRA